MKDSPSTAGFASRFLPTPQALFLSAVKGTLPNYCHVLLVVTLRKSGDMLQSIQGMNAAD